MSPVEKAPLPWTTNDLLYSTVLANGGAIEKAPLPWTVNDLLYSMLMNGGGGGGGGGGAGGGDMLRANNLSDVLNATTSRTNLGLGIADSPQFTGAMLKRSDLGVESLPGLSLINPTLAAVGAQQVSPSIVWTGQGWKTTATAASQTVAFRSFVLPVQGTTAATGLLQFQVSVDGAAFANVLSVDSIGNFRIGINPSFDLTLRPNPNAIDVSLGSSADTHITLGISSGTRKGVCFSSVGQLMWSNSSTVSNGLGSTINGMISIESAGVFQFGEDGSSPVAQTLKACDRITSDGAGANLTIAGGRNRGTSVGGSLIFQTAPGTTAGTAGVLATRLTIDSAGILKLPSSAILEWVNSQDIQMLRRGASNLHIGTIPGNDGITMTLTLGQFTRPGTDTNMGGANGIIQSALGTGAGAGSQLVFQTATPVASGSTVQTYATRLTLDAGTGVMVSGGRIALIAATLSASIQALSGAGAVNIVDLTTNVTSTGVNALTLAAGWGGQIKIITMVVDAGDATLTPTNRLGYSSIVFNDVGDSVMLQFTGTAWAIVANYGCTINP